MKKTLAVLGTILVFVLAIVLGVVVHLDAPIARRFVVARVNGALAATFAGTLAIDHVDHVSSRGISGANVRILSPRGERVIFAQGVTAKTNGLAIASSALFGDGPIAIAIDDAVIDHADVALDPGPDGRLWIEETFASRAPSATSGGGRTVKLTIARAVVRHAWVHRPGLDAEVDRLAGKVEVESPPKLSVKIDDARASVKTRGMPGAIDPAGDVTKVVVRVPGSRGARPSVEATFEGRVADVPATAVFSLDGSHLETNVVIARAPAAKIRALVPGLPLEEDVIGLTADAHGDLPALDARAAFALANGRGTVTATASLRVEEPSGGGVHGTGHVSVAAVDARAFVATAPQTSIGANADATLAIGKDVAVDFVVAHDAGTAAGQKLPPAKITGKLTKDASGVQIVGFAHVDEDGAPADVRFTVHDGVATFAASASIARLDRVPRIGPIATGSATIQSSGKVRLAEATIDATADADLHKLAKGDMRLDRGRLHARITGPIASPLVDATLTAEDVEGGGAKYPNLRATASGSALAPHVEAVLDGDASAEIHASADVDVASSTLRHARVEAKRGRTRVVASASAVRVAGGEVKVEDAVIEGLGEPVRATVRASKDEIVIRTQAKAIPLLRVARVFGMEKEIKGGTVDLDVDLLVDRKGAHGHVLADVSHARFAKLDDLDAHVDAKLDGRHVEATIHAALADVGAADVKTTNLTIGEAGPLHLDAWKKGFGRVDLDARIDLARLASLLPEGTLPVKEITGFLNVKGSAARDDQTDFTPELGVRASTEALAIVRENGDRIVGVDLVAEAKIDGDTGVATIASHAADGGGTFVTLDARSDAIPYQELFAGGAIVERLTRVPFTAKIGVPARDVGKLPAGLALAGTRGEVDGAVDFEGTARAPRVHLTAAARGLVTENSPVSFPIDAALDGHYDGVAFDADLETRSKRGPVATGSAHVDAKIDDLFAGRVLAWAARARVHLVGFPLNRIAPLGDRGIRGTATGDVTIDGLHTDDPRANADLAVTGLEIDAVKYTTMKLVATLDRSLTASVRVDQPDGFLEAKVQAGIQWRDRIVPGPDPGRALEGSVTAKSARASMFHPLIDETFSELEGRLDGTAHASLEPGRGANVEGAIALTDGLVQVASTGTELHDVKAKLSVTADGTVRVDDVFARGASGKLTASALAHLDGTSVKDASGKLEIPKSDPIPLDLGGVQMGDVYGTFTMRAKRLASNPKELDVDVDISTLHVTVPTSLSHPVRELDSPSNIHVGVGKDRRAESFRVVSLGAPQGVKTETKSDALTVLAVHFLDDIVVTRGKMLRVNIEGDPVVRFADTTTVSGQIRLRRGTLEVQSKKFEIEKGTVSFVGLDASNPTVVVSAGWTAPDGTRVYADFNGPLKTGKVTLRSEPPRPQSEILALILFGGAEGSAATPYASKANGAGSTATGAAGNVAAGGLAEGVDQLTGIDVAAKVDTSNPSNPRPEVEVQIAQSISLQIAYILGTPPPGTNPDKTFLTIDWRFLRQWSLQATRGDQGSSFADIVWQYRY